MLGSQIKTYTFKCIYCLNLKRIRILPLWMWNDKDQSVYSLHAAHSAFEIIWSTFIIEQRIFLCGRCVSGSDVETFFSRWKEGRWEQVERHRSQISDERRQQSVCSRNLFHEVQSVIFSLILSLITGFLTSRLVLVKRFWSQQLKTKILMSVCDEVTELCCSLTW